MHDHLPAQRVQAWGLINRTRIFLDKFGTDLETMDVLMEILILQQGEGAWPTLAQIEASLVLPQERLKALLDAALVQKLVSRCENRYRVLPETLQMVDFFTVILCEDIRETERALRSLQDEPHRKALAARQTPRTRPGRTPSVSSRKH